MQSHTLKDAALRLYFIVRLPFICLARLLLVVLRRKAGPVSRILIIRLDRMGDLVLTLPLIESLRTAYPAASIDLLVRPYLAELAGLIDGVDDVIVYHGVADAYRALPGRKYDIAIDMLRDYTLEPALVAASSGAPIRVGFKGGFREVLLTHAIDSITASPKSMIELNLELLKPLNVSATTTIPKMKVEKCASTPGATIAIHPGAHFESQKWPAQRFAALAQKIVERYQSPIVVIGGRDDKDAVEAIVQKADNKRIKAVFPDTKELVRLLAGSSLLVCNNSGPLHLAAALGVPTVSVMGPTDPVLWRPAGANQIVIRKAVECSPCSRAACSDHRCLDSITVDEVFDAARSLLDKIYDAKK